MLLGGAVVMVHIMKQSRDWDLKVPPLCQDLPSSPFCRGGN